MLLGGPVLPLFVRLGHCFNLKRAVGRGVKYVYHLDERAQLHKGLPLVREEKERLALGEESFLSEALEEGGDDNLVLIVKHDAHLAECPLFTGCIGQNLDF